MKIKATIDKQQLEIEVDEKVLEKAGYVKQKKEYKRWRAKKGQSYGYFIDGRVFVAWEYGDEFDNARYVEGNYYQTKELAQKALDRQLAIVRVNDRIMELNEGREGLAYIDYNISTREFNKWTFVGGFKKAQHLSLIANETVADQIISECEDDLKIIFGV